MTTCASAAPRTGLAIAPRGRALGTYVELVVTDEDALDPARRLLDQEIADLDLACSRFRTDSDLTRVNAGAGRPVPAGPLLRAAVRVALASANATEGLVDPTLARRLEELGYDRDFADLPTDGDVPAPDPRADNDAPPPWAGVSVDDASGTVLVPAGSGLDLGATAKAWCADRAAARIATALDVGALVSLGGDVATAGRAPVGGWPVRAATSSKRRGAGDETVLLGGGGLATSSPLARSWRRGGEHQHHVLDPRTGRPAEPCWASVSVAGPSCVDANTAATAGVVLGRAALRWLGGTGWPARLVALDGTVHRLGGWPEQRRWSQ